MAVKRLFENIEIDWERLKLPARDSVESSPAFPESPESLGTIREEEFRSVRSLLHVYDRATSLGLLSDSEWSRIAFLSTAAFCLRVGRDPSALLAHCLREGVLPAGLQDEDRACESLKRYLRNQGRLHCWLRYRMPAKE